MGGAIMSRPSLRDGLEPGEPLPLREENDYGFALQTFAYGAAWAIGFDLLHRAVPYLCKNHDWWKRLPNAKAKYEARAFMTATAHHIAMVPFSIWALLRDARNAHSLDLSYEAHRAILPFSTGYFLADLYFSRHDIVKSWDYSIHHIFAIMLLWRGASVRGAERFVPHFLITEATTMLLNVLWVLRKIDAESSTTYKLTGALFTSMYAVLRVYWLPFMSWKLYTQHERIWNGLGPVAWSTVGVSGLQVWWFYRILLKFAPVVNEALGIAKPAPRAVSKPIKST